jgi:hypothetical protein
MVLAQKQTKPSFWRGRKPRTYALQNEKSCKGGFIQTVGNKRKISKKTRPYDGLGIECVSPKTINVNELNTLKDRSIELNPCVAPN